MKRLNKKGFTLVELLAVIVVLAIIMVIATQAIGNVIKKNTVSSFKSSLDMAVKQAKQGSVMEGSKFDTDVLITLLDYDDSQYIVEVIDDKVCLTSKAGGKFDNMDESFADESWDWEKQEDNQTKACASFK